MWVSCFQQNLYRTLIMFLWRKTSVALIQVESRESYVCVPRCCWEGLSMDILTICFFKSHLFVISCYNFNDRYHLLNVCYSKSIPAYLKSLLLISSWVFRPVVSLVTSSFCSCWLSWSPWCNYSQSDLKGSFHSFIRYVLSSCCVLRDCKYENNLVWDRRVWVMPWRCSGLTSLGVYMGHPIRR